MHASGWKKEAASQGGKIRAVSDAGVAYIHP